MAFVGTLISAGIFGGLLYVVVSWGLTLPLSLLECFIFGSLISATDPVSVLGEYHTHTRSLSLSLSHSSCHHVVVPSRQRSNL
jgi:hypothetical protein